jgi:MFS family permease
VWITRALVMMGIWTVQPFILYYLTDVVGVENPEQLVGVVLGVALVAATFSGLLGGRLSDRIGRKRVVYTANSFIAVAALGFLFARTIPSTMLVATVFGLGFGAYYSVDWALACDVLPNKEDAAKDMGVWNIALVLPQSLAPLIAGPILQGFGVSHSLGPEGPVTHYSLAGYTVIFSLAAFYLILGAVLLRNVRGVK